MISDQEQNILFANCDTWLRLSQTIPAFAHGVQGMRVGEKRTIFVQSGLGLWCSNNITALHWSDHQGAIIGY